MDVIHQWLVLPISPKWNSLDQIAQCLDLCLHHFTLRFENCNIWSELIMLSSIIRGDHRLVWIGFVQKPPPKTDLIDLQEEKSTTDRQHLNWSIESLIGFDQFCFSQLRWKNKWHPRTNLDVFHQDEGRSEIPRLISVLPNRDERRNKISGIILVSLDRDDEQKALEIEFSG